MEKLPLKKQTRKLSSITENDFEYVYNPLFSLPHAEKTLFGEEAENIETSSWIHFSIDELEENPTPRKKKLLNREDEKTLFLRYNYARYRLSKLVGESAKRAATQTTAELWMQRVRDLRQKLVQANMALIPAMAKRNHLSPMDMDDFISEGNIALLFAIDKFDPSMGYRFSTYACRSILNRFFRLSKKNSRIQEYFPVNFLPEMEKSDFVDRRHEDERENAIEAVRQVLARNSANLSQIEKTVLLKRFPISSNEKNCTLQQIGQHVGLTNERVRQIEKKMLLKIRSAVENHFAA
jgi:RNA polymerase sigma factor (sigma-70 family)